MAASSSSSSRSMVSPEVFVSFRVDELGNDFINYIGKTFQDDDILFTDSRCDLGQGTGSLFQHIEDSKIALVIVSKRYSESGRCLDELSKIMEKTDKVVIPIFFKVEVEDVMNKWREFGMQNVYCSDYMPKWKKALESLPIRMTFVLSNDGDEKEFILHIVKEVLSIINLLQFPVSGVREKGEDTSTLVTRDVYLHRVEQQDKKLEEMSVGMLSIGKTIEEMSSYIQLICDRITHLDQGLNDDAEMCTRKIDRKVCLPPQHQVFISFRGELRYSFISHLVRALRRKKINVFIDKHERKGEDISHLLKRIEESGIAIVVFSSKYTDATWCLREAEKIQERAAQGKLKVIPIFYKVTPENVKLISGEFGDNFRDYRRKHQNEKSVNNKRKEALKFIGGKIGFVLNDQSDEDEYIASIVKEILQMLTSIPFATQTVESHVNQFLYRGETSKSTSHVNQFLYRGETSKNTSDVNQFLYKEETTTNTSRGISINEPSSHCYSSTAQSNMYMSRSTNLFSVGPHQSNYTTDNTFPSPWRTMTTSHYQPTNHSWRKFSDESSDGDSGQKELYLPAKQSDAFRYKKKVD